MKLKSVSRIVIPLALGAAIYLLLCPETFLSRWFYALPGLRPPAISAGGALVRLVRNHLPDMLWAFALTCCVSRVLGGRPRTAVLIAAGTGLFAELLQRAMGVGTFDWLDVALEALAAAAAVLCERRQTQ